MFKLLSREETIRQSQIVQHSTRQLYLMFQNISAMRERIKGTILDQGTFNLSTSFSYFWAG